MRKNKFLLVAASVALLVSCGQNNGRPTFGDNEYPVVEVGTSSAAMQSVYPATIKGVQDVQISPKQQGFITKIFVKEGQSVGAGQVLFELDNATYQAQVRQAQAAVNTAKTQCNTAQLTYENAKKLFENKVVGEYELQTAQNGFEQAKAALAQTEALLANAKETLSFCFVKSPASGVVGTLPFKVGTLVTTSSVMTTVSDNSTMEVYFSLNEKDILAMTKAAGSQSAALAALPSVKLQLADGSMYGHEGKVTKMSGVIDPTTGAVQMIALFPNPEKMLKSGGSGNVIIPREQTDAIVIPQGCVMEVQNKLFVYLLKDSNKVAYTEITVDPQNDGMNYVVTGGMKVGDKYVANGVTKLSDKMEIVPITLERYNEKIKEHSKALGAGEMVEALSPKK
jgi:membrane fusion protein (multidrug efflux system)